VLGYLAKSELHPPRRIEDAERLLACPLLLQQHRRSNIAEYDATAPILKLHKPLAETASGHLASLLLSACVRPNIYTHAIPISIL